MIQSGSYLNIIDNSGAKKATCIKFVKSGYKQRYAKVGSIVLVSIKSSKNHKIKKGDMHKAVIIKTKTKNYSIIYNYKKNFNNCAVLINKQNKSLGSRIFGRVPKQFKYSKFLRLVTLSAGLSL
jgi:large subunit ribosomal protein L14